MNLDNNSVLDIKQTDEFKNNLKIIMSQAVIDKDKAEILLENNNNNLVNTLIQILEPYKLKDTTETVIDDPHKVR